jgi:two-component system nitrate/nitrite response regulator NarL
LLPIIELGLAAHDPTLGEPDPIGLDRLTTREAEVARHAARGLTSRHIGLLLGTSQFTVRNQLCRIFDKLGVASRSELAGWLVRRQAHGADVPFRSDRPLS